MPFDPPQPFPTGDGADDAATLRIARELALLIGPGYQPTNDALAGADLLALATLLASLETHQTETIGEAFAQTVTDDLAEWETRLGLPTDPRMAVTDRRAAIMAKRRASSAGSASRVLAAAQAIDPTAAIFTTSATTAAAGLEPRGVFVFALRIAAAVYSDPTKLAQIQQIVDQRSAATDQGNVCVTYGFVCDDDNSLTDRDVLDS